MSDFVSTVDDERQKYFIYRITGKQSIERLDPLIQLLFINNYHKINDDDNNHDNDNDREEKIMNEELMPIIFENYQVLHHSLGLSNYTSSINNKSILSSSNTKSIKDNITSNTHRYSSSSSSSSLPFMLDFVWETTCEKSFKYYHKHSSVINKLHNSSIIESKACLAYLQLLFNDNDNRNDSRNHEIDHHQHVHVLPTYVASCLSEVKYWASNRWGTITTSLPSPASLSSLSSSLSSSSSSSSSSSISMQTSTIPLISSLPLDDKTTVNNKEDCHDLTISLDTNNAHFIKKNVDNDDCVMQDYDHNHVVDDAFKQDHVDDEEHDDENDYDWWV
jgi:hypothetical protein